MTTTGLLDRPMTGKRPRKPKRTEGDPPAVRASIKLPEDVVDSARVVSALKNQPMAELLADLLRPLLAKLERELLAERSRALDDSRRKPKSGE